MSAETSGGRGQGGEAKLSFVPPEYHEDPAETRRSVRRLLELPFTILCLAHRGADRRRSQVGAARTA